MRQAARLVVLKESNVDLSRHAKESHCCGRPDTTIRSCEEYKTNKLSETEKVLERHTEFISGKDTIATVSVEDPRPKTCGGHLTNAYLTALHGLNDRIAVTEAGQRRLFFETAT